MKKINILSLCSSPRYSTRFDAHTRKFMKKDFPRDSDAKKAALAYYKKVISLLMIFDASRGKVHSFLWLTKPGQFFNIIFIYIGIVNIL